MCTQLAETVTAAYQLALGKWAGPGLVGQLQNLGGPARLVTMQVDDLCLSELWTSCTSFEFLGREFSHAAVTGGEMEVHHVFKRV